MTDFTFSERLYLVSALRLLAHKIGLSVVVSDQYPAGINAEKIQKLIDELGGNPELNTKRYLEEEIRRIVREEYYKIQDEFTRKSLLEKRDRLSSEI